MGNDFRRGIKDEAAGKPIMRASDQINGAYQAGRRQSQPDAEPRPVLLEDVPVTLLAAILFGLALRGLRFALLIIAAIILAIGAYYVRTTALIPAGAARWGVLGALGLIIAGLGIWLMKTHTFLTTALALLFIAATWIVPDLPAYPAFQTRAVTTINAADAAIRGWIEP